MKSNYKLTNNSLLNIITRIILVPLIILLFWHFNPSTQKSQHPYPSKLELVEEVRNLTFNEAGPPAFSIKEKKLAIFGKALFEDKRFSANGKISCSKCHDSQQSYSDGLKKAEGLGKTNRRAPSIINSFASHWFFWDGRSDSLESQALGPIEHPKEHGISRTHVVSLIKKYYLDEFETHFGKWPSSLQAELPTEASPKNSNASMSSKMSMYTLASLKSFALQDKILSLASKIDSTPTKIISEITDLTPNTPQDWSSSWNSLTSEQQKDINFVFSCFGKAIAQFEKGIVAIRSPFDLFAKNLISGKSEQESFVKGFKEKELIGLKIFTGPGQCSTCHMGPNFTDQQFHNIGLPLSSHDILKDPSLYIDVGRSVGVLIAKSSPFNCLGDYFSNTSESCKELPWLAEDSLELVGAFKTPSLRNVEERAPYTHDGRFSNLKDLLTHYKDLDPEAGIGHLEETLLEISLNEKDLEDLEAFLRSLTSPVTDMSTEKSLTQTP